jgi:hypothetical protein
LKALDFSLLHARRPVAVSLVGTGQSIAAAAVPISREPMPYRSVARWLRFRRSTRWRSNIEQKRLVCSGCPKDKRPVERLDLVLCIAEPALATPLAAGRWQVAARPCPRGKTGIQRSKQAL